MIEITGATRVLLIAADPVAHVKTPQALNAIAAERGRDIVMVPCHVDSSGLPALLEGLRGMQSLAGLVVTAPHKVSAAALCDRLEAQASMAGAVNSIRRDADGSLVGEIFDGLGFVGGLRASGHRIEGQSVFLAGAGGAANAIAFALAAAGIARLAIANRTPEKAEVLARRLARHFPALEISVGEEGLGAADIAVNATSAGLKSEDSHPFDVSRARRDALIAEVIMQPPITALLQAAREQGLAIHPGQAMLENQLALIARFLGVTE
ncbi:hypothetical protein [Sphingopyxis sp.]|jgi:shikimate dehydrogenase|uniref:shikimate dehydrogenase family protein n=1 Tax=Sphingopyxis sp. TaxID=1908224 RepID=UPI002DE4ECF7|nr:hypothetical protein [Sphingopyxis sp.]